MALLTIIKNLRGYLTKSFELCDGRLSKVSDAELGAGTATQVRVTDLAALAEVAARLSSMQALVFGVCRLGFARVVAQGALSSCRDRNAVCRDREHFSWPSGRGVLMLDVDRPKDASEPFSPESFDALMCELLPWWSSVGRMYRPSASAFISDEAGNMLAGAGSLRCYAIAQKAQDIPFIGVRVADAFWKAGYGRIEFSDVGSRLPRCPVDTTVWQPERLDFAGPAVLGRGLTKVKSAPLVKNGPDIESEAALAGFGRLSQSQWAAKSEAVQKARRVAWPEERRRKKIVIEQRVRKDIVTGEDEKRSRFKWSSALMHGILSGNYILHFVDGDVTVNEALSDPGRYDQQRLADPEEPNYGNDRRIAIFYANNGRPHIYSHAHGGKKYTLVRG